MEPTTVDQIHESLPALRREYMKHVKNLAERALDHFPAEADREAREEWLREAAALSPWATETHKAAVVVLVSQAAKTTLEIVAGPLPKILELAAATALASDAGTIAELSVSTGRAVGA